MTPLDYKEIVGYLLGSFASGFWFGYLLAVFKIAAKISTR